MAEISVFRPGDVSYLRIPAPDPERLEAYYAYVFGWHIRSGSGSFEDASGHIIGHFISDLTVVGEAGVLPYIYVQNIGETLARITDRGGSITTEPYPEGNLWVAMTVDPAGNAVGVWQHGPRGQDEA